MINFRTDLADERANMVRAETKQKDMDGIISEEKKYSDKFSVNKVKVINENGSKKIDKKIGTYITLDISNVDIINKDELQEAQKIFSNNLSQLLKNYKSILVVGLGNEDTTADSIGSKVVKDLEITRHILKYNPELLPEQTVELSAIAPGVLGTTGMETQEILKGIIDKIHFDAIIAIDALASNNISRLLRTIQLCDTGIVPGSGVNNKRKEISLDTMEVPVIAVGVPTVVNAATIVADTLDILARQFNEFNFLQGSTYSDKYQLIQTVLEPSNFNLAVMPKEIDNLVDNMKEIIAGGINISLWK
ncbi:MAG: GPR endopeptidase [Clostridia bacterium]|nr:GPR endopeptidase [Clostridia bacterium]